MRQTYSYNSITWIDLHRPTTDELGSIIEEYQISPTVADKLSSPHIHPEVMLTHNAIFCAFRFPAHQHTHTAGGTAQQIAVLLTPAAVITAHSDTIDALHKLSKTVETQTILHRESPVSSSAEFFFAIFKKLYKSVYHEIEYAEDWLNAEEDNIFRGHERDMVFTLSKISRQLLDIKKTIHLHDELLRSLRQAGPHLFPQAEFAHGVDELLDEYYKIEEQIEANLAIVDELRETNNSLLSTKQNETMQTFTVLAFVTLPLTIVASLFNMNTVYMPIVGLPHDFWIIVSIMVVLALLLYLGFKRKGIL